mmetsp:Transcript_33006/g.37847  ORF Transcript_33006/g.37847 Transcript_33006/m.37847 type:complete len:467 (+) Transcript_33006:84-1484(+)
MMVFPWRNVVLMKMFVVGLVLLIGSLLVVTNEASLVASGKEEINTNTHHQKEEEEVVGAAVVPNFTKGGIFVFLHLSKTGGTSFWALMNKLQDKKQIDFHWKRQRMTQQDITDSIASATSQNNKKAVVYLFHAEYPNPTYPTILDAAPLIDEWRTQATDWEVPFFAATTVRAPLGHALSVFNFYHVTNAEEDWNPFVGNLAPTEENFLKTFVPNRLCHLMTDDPHGIVQAPAVALREDVLEERNRLVLEQHEQKHDQGLKKGQQQQQQQPQQRLRKIPNNKDEEEETVEVLSEQSVCDITTIHNILFVTGTFDYVGVTEQCSTHSFPLFMDIIVGNPAVAGIQTKVAKNTEFVFSTHKENSRPPLKQEDLSETTRQQVALESALDQQLYQTALERLVQSQWPSYEHLSNDEAVAIAAVDALPDDEDEDDDNNNDDDGGDDNRENFSDSDKEEDGDEEDYDYDAEEL